MLEMWGTCCKRHIEVWDEYGIARCKAWTFPDADSMADVCNEALRFLPDQDLLWATFKLGGIRAVREVVVQWHREGKITWWR